MPLTCWNERIQVLIRDNYEKKLLIKSSEMESAAEQINPHFLYNALSVISSMAMREGGKRTVKACGISPLLPDILK